MLLKEIRNIMKVTQQEASTGSGVNITTLQKLESGVNDITNASASTVENLARYYNISCESITMMNEIGDKCVGLQTEVLWHINCAFSLSNYNSIQYYLIKKIKGMIKFDECILKTLIKNIYDTECCTKSILPKYLICSVHIQDRNGDGKITINKRSIAIKCNRNNSIDDTKIRNCSCALFSLLAYIHNTIVFENPCWNSQVARTTKEKFNRTDKSVKSNFTEVVEQIFSELFSDDEKELKQDKNELKEKVILFLKGEGGGDIPDEKLKFLSYAKISKPLREDGDAIGNRNGTSLEVSLAYGLDLPSI